jgi:hypothetical protein
MPDTTGVWNGIDWWFNEERKNAPIHPSWIQDDQNILADLWNAGELGVDIAQTLKDAFDFFTAASNALTDAAIQTIQDLLDNALDNSNASLSINWANLTNKPIARNNYNVGMRGDLFMTSNTKIRALPTSLSIDQWNNPQFIGSPSGATLIDIGSREAFLKYLTLSNTDTSTLYTADEIIPTASNFKLYTLRFSSNSIRNSTSNIVINGITMCNDTMEESVVEADKFFASRYVAPEGKGSALTFFTSQTTLKHQNTTPSNALDWRFSQLQMTDREFKYEKYASVNEGGAQTILFQANSNGEFYTYSNWRTNSPAVIRAIETSIDDFPREALFFMNNTNFRWIRRTVVSNSNQDTISASFSSNGLLLGERPALFGKVETVLLNPLLSNDFIVKFPRLEYSFSNGLTYGYGFCQNPIMGDYDIFNVSYKGEISTLNHQNFLMRQILNSNANLTTNLIINSNVSLTSNGGLSINNRTSLTSNGLTVSNLTIASNGAIFYNGKEFLNEAGSLRMRTFTDPSSNQGLTISTGGIVQINGSEFQITNDGIATIRQPITASNISTSNMTVASNLTASNLSASNAVLSNLRLHNKTMTVNSGGTDFLASNSTQSNCSFNFINQQSIGNYSYLYVNPVHNQGGDNPYTNVGVFTYSNNLSQGLGRLNLQGTVLYNFTRLEDQFAPSNILSNLATSNNIAALSNSLSNVNSNFLTFSNWTNTQYSRSNDLSNLSSNLALLSNSLSNVNSNWQTFSNWTNSQYSRSNQLSNYTTVSTFNSYSNYADGAFRKVSVQVPWTQISGKPNFSDCNDSLSIGGAVLGAAGLTLGAIALLNQNGQLTDVLTNAANSLRLNPNGYSRFNDGLEVLDTASGLPRISLDPSGAFSALTGNFSQGARFGQFSITLSNDQVIFGSNTTSNMVLSSNSLTVRNNLPFTFSNANVLFTCNVGIGVSNPTEQLHIQNSVRLGGGNFYTSGTFTYFASGWFWNGSDWSNINSPNGGFMLRNGGSNQSLQIWTGSNALTQKTTIQANGLVGIGTTAPAFTLDVSASATSNGLRASACNANGDFRGCHLLENRASNNPCILSLLAPNLASNSVRTASFTIGQGHTNGDLVQFLYNYVGTGNSSNALTISFWGGNNVLCCRNDTRVGVGTVNPTTTLDVNGDCSFRSNARANNLISTNGVAIGTSNTTPLGTAVINNNIQGNTFFGTTTSNLYLWRVVNEDIDINSNQVIGGITLRTYNTVGSAPYQFLDRQLYGLGFVVRDGLNSNVEAINIDNRGRVGIGMSNPLYPLDVLSTTSNAIRSTGCNSLGNFRSTNVLINTASNNPAVLDLLTPNIPTTGTNRCSFNIGRDFNNGNLVQMIYNYFGNANSNNSLSISFWGASPVMNIQNGGSIGIGVFNPTARLDINGDVIARSNLTTSNVSACNIAASSNITLAGTSIYTQFAPSNQLSNYALSNQLSNYAPSNAMSNWNFASNTAVWSSNNFNNFAPSGNFADTSNYAYTDRYWTWNSAVFTNSNVSISSNQYLEFGTGISKQTDAGRISYRRLGDSNSLDIVGAGTTAGARRVKIWNILSIQNGTIEGQDNSGLTISGFNLGTNFVGIGHSNQAGNVGTYAIGQDLNAQTFINANSNQSVNFRINDTNRAIMNSNGNFIMDRRLVIASNIAVDGSAFSFTTTTGGNLAIFYANSYNYLAAPGADGSSNLFAIQKNGDVAINRGDLSITNRNHTFLIQCGMKGGTSNNLWTTIDPSSHVYQYGDIELNGTLTAINKNFTINHPILPNKKLIHSSVESPQHDLMYSGMTTLSNGIATVNLDSDGCPFSPMTAGTFEALTKNTRFFLQNKTGWTALKGDISGATLTITSQDPTDDDVYFCVVAERKDTQILESSSTYNGHLITQIDA